MLPTDPPNRVVREPERQAITGIPTSTWYALQDQGLAPRPVPLGPRSRGWLVSELEEWIERRKAERDARAAAS
jgi:prophage regulatory protein